MAATLSWAVSHAEGRVTQSIRSVFTAAIQEFATHRCPVAPTAPHVAAATCSSFILMSTHARS